MVDALIGVVIASMMIVIVLTTLRLSQNQLRQAEDRQAARVLLQSLLETTPRVAGSYIGQKPQFSYRVEVREEGGDQKICVLSANVTSLANKRTYHLEGTRWCARPALS